MICASTPGTGSSMSPRKSVSVDSTALHMAFEFVSPAAPLENSAYVCIDTGRIYWTSCTLDVEEEGLPEDLESDRYIAVPHKNDLDLGRNLAMSFVDRQMAADHQTVATFFRRKGAYGRFKQLLEARGMLQRWYDFESQATEDALRQWCEENGIRLSEEAP